MKQWEYNMPVVYGAIDGSGDFSKDRIFGLSIVVGLFIFAWSECGARV